MAQRRKKSSVKAYAIVGGLIVAGAMFSDKIMPYVEQGKNALGIK